MADRHVRQVHVPQARPRLAAARAPERGRRIKREFLAACEDFAEDRPLRAYSTVGTRGDTDLLLVSQSPILDDIHTFHVVLAQSGLAQWATIPYSYLAMTKPSPYSDSETRPEICTSRAQVRSSSTRWRRSASGTGCPLDERRRIMADHIETGRRYPEITINTAYSFGIDDQEFVVSFEGDEPGEFLDLVQELRGTESSAYTLRDTPIFSCVAMSRRPGARRARRRRHLRGSPPLAPRPATTLSRDRAIRDLRATRCASPSSARARPASTRPSTAQARGLARRGRHVRPAADPVRPRPLRRRARPSRRSSR